MRKYLTLLVAVIVVVVLVTYMFVFTVRYDERAVVTTFGNADENSVKVEPGPYLKAPWPIQSVETYSTRLQLLEDQLEERQTADGFAVVVRTFVVWKIVDPLKFFTAVKKIEDAPKQLSPMLRGLGGIISQYNFDELVNIDPAKLKLHDVEQKIQAQLQARADVQGYGIVIDRVGVRRIMLPESVTQNVFDRMRASRQRLAEDARSSGKAKADAIVSKARATEQRILAFAERRAQNIRSQGLVEAAKYYEAFQADPEFAIFLKTVASLEESLKNNTTFIFGPEGLPGLGMFLEDPGTE